MLIEIETGILVGFAWVSMVLNLCPQVSMDFFRIYVVLNLCSRIFSIALLGVKVVFQLCARISFGFIWVWVVFYLSMRERFRCFLCMVRGFRWSRWVSSGFTAENNGWLRFGMASISCLTSM
jgi:hypothetical protein